MDHSAPCAIPMKILMDSMCTMRTPRRSCRALLHPTRPSRRGWVTRTNLKARSNLHTRRCEHFTQYCSRDSIPLSGTVPLALARTIRRGGEFRAAYHQRSRAAQSLVRHHREPPIPRELLNVASSFTGSCDGCGECDKSAIPNTILSTIVQLLVGISRARLPRH